MKGDITVMLDRFTVASYSLVTLAGICFISGLAVMMDERRQ